MLGWLERLGRGRSERRVGHVDRQLVRGWAGGEPHHRVLEHQRQHRARCEEGFEPACSVGDGGGQLAADVAEQPDALLLGDAEELAMEVAVAVVEDEVGVAPDRERLPVDGRGLTAEVDVGSHCRVVVRSGGQEVDTTSITTAVTLSRASPDSANSTRRVAAA